MSTKGIRRVRQYILGWVGLPVLAVLNGLIREFTYCKVFGEETAHQISAVILSMIIIVYVNILNSKIQLQNTREALLSGFVWLVLTIMFEFILGFARGIPADQQLQSYNVLSGDLWILILVTVFLAPVILRGHRMIRFSG